jgi:hypothetical protein
MSDASDAMIRQAAALAVQDAAAHMRRVQMIASAALGVSQETILRGGNEKVASAAATAAQKMVEGATANFIALAEAASRLGASEGPKS